MLVTDEQQQIADAVRDFAQERLRPFAEQWDKAHRFPREAIDEMAALGLFGMLVPEQYGGSDTGYVAYAMALEEIAAGDGACSTIMSVHNSVGCVPILKFGTEQQKQQFLAPLASGAMIGAFALTEPQAGSDASSLKTRARLDGDHYVLNGSKQFISGAGTADFYFVFARTGGEGANGVSAFAVMKDAPGLSFGALEKKMGWNAQPTRQVIFDNCKVPAANLIGEEGRGFRFAMSGLDGGRINIGACSVGAAWAALDKARQYSTERKAFGRAIADFQALQFKMADMATELEAARLMIYRAADALDRADPQASMYSAMAKRFATDLGFKIVNDALQVHGGYGYLRDYGLEKLVRDLRVHQILEGTNEIMRVVVSRKLLGGNRG